MSRSRPMLSSDRRRALSRPPRSCASSPAESIPPCSPTAASPRPIDALVSRATVPVEVARDAGGRLPACSLESTAYFTVAEALTNVAKYAQATHATVRIAPRRSRGRWWGRSPDDGVGGADAALGSGLKRAGRPRRRSPTGRLSVQSPPGKGTVIRAVLPVPKG